MEVRGSRAAGGGRIKGTWAVSIGVQRDSLVGVLVLNRNGRDWLPGLYESLRAEGSDNKRVYLIDNASDDDSVELTCREYPEVIVLRFPENFGYCMAYNLAMQVAWRDGCDWTIWQNNDTLVLSGWLNRMLDAAAADPRIGVVGPAFYAWDRDEPNYYMTGANPAAVPSMLAGDPAPVDVPWVEGSCLMVSRECVEDVGWLDPWLFFYFEETDFCQRARQRGWRVVLAPTSLARHYGGGSSGGDAARQLPINWLQQRNLHIGYLAHPGRSWLRNTTSLLHLALIQQKEAWLAHRSPQRAWMHLKVLGWIAWHTRAIHRKFLRDRQGEKFAPLLPEYEQMLQRQPLEVIEAITRPVSQ
jgi:GT2 family glycosyltransferase